ncbi:MAG: Rieske (2Fe-2S) protein [Candidatus Bathyarchaeia archaeon]|jgi:3-phenylpropionate/trans-cinnamate dioxygenase ferredoxin subunit
MIEQWFSTMEEDTLEENSMNAVFPKGIPVLIVKKNSKIYAVSNKCPHLGCPLSAGTLEGHTIKCLCHDWKFDITSGEFLSSREIKIPIYQYKIQEGKIFIKI